jgi:UDP-glucose 4-epimerase
MKILVTGGAGYIGSHTALALLEAGYYVVVLDNFSNSFPESLTRVGKLAGKKPVAVEGDLTDSSLLQNLFEDHKDISAVIHFAALKAVEESTEYPLKYYHNNVSGSICLLKAMEEAGVHQLVFSSSCTVYGEPKRVPLDESHPVGGVSSPYGRTKFQMEEIIRDHSSANPNFKAGVLRYFNPVGAHPSGEIGEDPNGIPDNLVPFVCQVATGQREKLRVFGDDYPTRDGTAVRDYLHVVDLADAHLKALEALNNGDTGFTCNLGTGKGSSVLEVITAFEKATGKKIPFEIVGRRAGDVTEAWADPSYAEKLLGWKTVRGLEEMLSDAWHWQSKNLNGYRSANNNP